MIFLSLESPISKYLFFIHLSNATKKEISRYFHAFLSFFHRDAFSVIRNSNDFKTAIDILSEVISPLKPDYIVGLESRGFLLTGALCYALNLPFVLIRKKNKLPGLCKQIKYSLHYGEVRL
jgi:adenine phosphoribosyltransferase